MNLFSIVLLAWSSRVALSFSNIGDSPGYFRYITEDSNGTLSLKNLTSFAALGDKGVDSPLTAAIVNHYSMIGMPLPGGMEENVLFVLHQPEIFPLKKVPIPGIDEDDCHYVVCTSESSGGQLWGYAEKDDQMHGLYGFAPHFGGKSRINMCILKANPTPHGMTTYEKKLCGSLVGIPDLDGEPLKHINRQEGGIELKKTVFETDEGVIAAAYAFEHADTRECFMCFDFDCPNFGLIGDTPAQATIQLTGFAEGISTYDSVEDYRSKQEEEEEEEDKTNLASQCFLSGAYLQEEEGRDRPVHAIVVGHVVETELRTNDKTHQSFYWALVRTRGDMEIDIVIHPEMLSGLGEKPPKVGGVIMASCYICGVLIDDNQAAW